MKGLILSVCIFMILSFLFAPIIFLTNLSESNGIFYVIAILCVSSFAYGFYSGKKIGQKGLIVGAISAFIFLLVVLFSVFIAFFKEPNIDFLSPIYVLPILLGGIGGIVGVNVKK